MATEQRGATNADTIARIADDLERIVVGAVGLTTEALARAETDFEMTFPQWRAVLVVGGNADGVRVGEVAARVGVTLPATGRLLRRLERRGLTSLTADADDRRATRVRLTTRGHEIRSAILAHRRVVLDRIAADLPDTQREGLVVGLRVIANELESYA
jgi:DNA-binding MarR family transcriptional regulator